MINPAIRFIDDYGSGAYLASRGERYHEGVDYCAYPESILLSDVCGYITRIGWVYNEAGPKGQYQLVEIKVDDMTRALYFYVDPIVKAGDIIKFGQPLGKIQDLRVIYPATRKKQAITPHYHLEIWVEGDHVNPELWLNNYRERYKLPNISYI